MLASGIAGVSVHSDQDGIATFDGRMADGIWVFWFGTQNSGGPQASLPGDMVVCADGRGLHLRAEPSTRGPIATLIADGAIVRGDHFVMTDRPSASGAASTGLQPHPAGITPARRKKVGRTIEIEEFNKRWGELGRPTTFTTVTPWLRSHLSSTGPPALGLARPFQPASAARVPGFEVSDRFCSSGCRLHVLARPTGD
jgi:hypothetical protein